MYLFPKQPTIIQLYIIHTFFNFKNIFLKKLFIFYNFAGAAPAPAAPPP